MTRDPIVTATEAARQNLSEVGPDGVRVATIADRGGRGVAAEYVMEILHSTRAGNVACA